MPEQKPDVVEQFTVRSMVAVIADVVVDHRLFLHAAVILFAVFALRNWGPDDLSRGIDYVATAGTAPVRVAGRIVGGALGLATNAAESVDHATQSTGVVPPGDSKNLPALTLPAVGPTPHSTAVNPPAVSTLTPPQSAVKKQLDLPRTAAPIFDRQAADDSEGEATATSGGADTVLWVLLKDAETLRAEVHDRGTAGVDLVIFKNGKLWRRERWADRASARTEASLKRADLEKLGWSRPRQSH
jgi:hypothetical protein